MITVARIVCKGPCTRHRSRAFVVPLPLVNVILHSEVEHPAFGRRPWEAIRQRLIDVLQERDTIWRQIRVAWRNFC